MPTSTMIPGHHQPVTASTAMPISQIPPMIPPHSTLKPPRRGLAIASRFNGCGCHGCQRRRCRRDRQRIGRGIGDRPRVQPATAGDAEGCAGRVVGATGRALLATGVIRQALGCAGSGLAHRRAAFDTELAIGGQLGRARFTAHLSAPPRAAEADRHSAAAPIAAARHTAHAANRSRAGRLCRATSGRSRG